MADAMSSGFYWEIGDPMLYWPLFWPQRRNTDGLRILVAGCGTVQAAYYALRNPTWTVVGIDFSESSLKHQAVLKKRHHLENLELHKLDLEDVATLGKEFDFITCTGADLKCITIPCAFCRCVRNRITLLMDYKVPMRNDRETQKIIS